MRPILRKFLISASIVVSLSLAPSLALAAGPAVEEIWFGTGADSLDTDDSGKLTAEGEKTRATEVDRIPGEDDWELKIHARMGKYAAAGPLYVEFFQTVQGQEYIVHRHGDPDYDGSRLYTAVILLDSNIGFNKDREYRVQIIQNNGTRDLVMAKGQVKLIDTGRKGPEDEDEDEGSEDEDEDEGEDEDGEEASAPAKQAPPAIAETPATKRGSKKGCSVVPGGALDVGFSGVALLLLAGVARRRRRAN